jgi:CHASE1-domain containing sensor protein
VRASEQERFDRVVGMTRAAIDGRLESYLQIRMGVRALFASSSAVERAEFRLFVDKFHVHIRCFAAWEFERNKPRQP